MSNMCRVTIVLYSDDNRKVRADWHGGARIELSIGTGEYLPVEEINVWDYETDSVRGGEVELNTYEECRRFVMDEAVAWMDRQDEDWPEWYQGYQEAGMYR